MRAYARIHGVGYMFGPFIAGSPEPVSIRTQLANALANCAGRICLTR
jgi:hypothetical protein